MTNQGHDVVADAQGSRAIADETEGLRALFASAPDLMADPAPVWRAAQDAGPVVRIGPSLLVTRYADVRAIVRDPEHFSSDSSRRGTHAEHMRSRLHGEALLAFEEMYAFQGLFLVETDDPEHVRLRRIIHRAFTPRAIAVLQGATERYVDEILSGLAAEGDGVDLKRLAYRIPLMIIGDIVGVPRADQEQLKAWTETWGKYRAADDERVILAWEAQKQLRDYVKTMIAEHRGTPGSGDVISTMMGAQHDEVLTTDELAALFFILIFGGHETTTNLIATGVLELLRRPEQWRALCEEPESIPAAIDELLRYISPVQWITRRATRDVEIAGRAIPADSHLYLGLASANRDPEIFADPDVLDIRRSNAGQHIAFGFGPHFCLGSSLARLEGTIALRTLARRFPEVTLVDDSPDWTGYAQLRTLAELPVRLGRERT